MTQSDLFAQSVVDRVQLRVAAARLAATPEQLAVLEVLVATQGKVTQRQIARQCPMLGHHWREEDSAPENETTLRKVRQLVRDLRVKFRVPVLSDPKGYWLPTYEEEIAEYVDRVEKQARATAQAWFETLHSLEGFIEEERHHDLFDEIPI
jgi:hypothetical protein